MAINLDDLYAVLAPVARTRLRPAFTYTDLSHSYNQRTGEWYEPHGSWDNPLGELNRALDAIGWPPISAVVVLKATEEPGGLFWESCRSIPRRPANDIDRIAEYGRILARVQATPWPDQMPVGPPPR